jgi:hypothetical protein
MKIKFLLPLLLVLAAYVSADAVCSEDMWMSEIKADIEDNGVLDCKRVPLPPPTDRTETKEETAKRMAAIWDSGKD